MEKEKIADKLVLDVISQADSIAKANKKNSESTFESEIKKYTEAIEEETNLFIQQELEELKLSLTQNESQSKWTLKRDLLEKRSALVNQLFDEVKEDLIAFTKKNDYSSYCKKHLQRIQETIDVQSGSLLVKKADMKLFEELVKELKLTLLIQTMDHILIGGFKFVSQDGLKEVDETLDTILANQMEWFYKNSNFVL